MIGFFDPFDTAAMPPYTGLEKLELSEAVRISRWSVIAYVAGIIIGLALCSLFAGCTTSRSTEKDYDFTGTALMAQKMDSLIHISETWQQRNYEKQTSLVDSVRHSEIRDTSRTFFLGQHGDTIKEKTVVYVERNSSQTSKESTTERLEEQLIRTDSMLQVSLDRQEKLELLLRDHEKTTVVEKKPPWYQRLLPAYSIFMTLAVLVLMACVWLIRKKKSPPANIK